MPQESVRDEQTERFIDSAIPVYEDEGVVSDIKGQYLGGKTRYQFTCQDCHEATYITENRYAHNEGEIKSIVRQSALYELRRFIRELLYNIPVIGYQLGWRLPQPSRNHNGSVQREGKVEAFEEAKEKFHRCNSCGSFVCNDCYSNGLCSKCKENS